jgi:hypothetical protein
VVQELRGFFRLEPPAGGLDRLRLALRRAGDEGRWLQLLPWATAALMLVVLCAATLLREDPADLVVAEVRAQEAQPWEQLSGPGADVMIYVARPVELVR